MIAAWCAHRISSRPCGVPPKLIKKAVMAGSPPHQVRGGHDELYSGDDAELSTNLMRSDTGSAQDSWVIPEPKLSSIAGAIEDEVRHPGPSLFLQCGKRGPVSAIDAVKVISREAAPTIR